MRSYPRPPNTVRALHSSLEEIAVLSSLVNSRQFAPTQATKVLSAIGSYLFLHTDGCPIAVSMTSRHVVTGPEICGSVRYAPSKGRQKYRRG